MSHFDFFTNKCVPNTPAPNPNGGGGGSHYMPGFRCPVGTHYDQSSRSCVPLPFPCPPGSRFSPEDGGRCVPFGAPCPLGTRPEGGQCVPFGAPCPPGTSLSPLTGTCEAHGNVCDFTSPFACTPAQRFELRDVTQAQFLGATTQPCATGISWGAPDLYW